MVESEKTEVLKIENILGEDVAVQFTTGRVFIKGINFTHYLKDLDVIEPDEEFTITISKSKREQSVNN